MTRVTEIEHKIIATAGQFIFNSSSRAISVMDGGTRRCPNWPREALQSVMLMAPMDTPHQHMHRLRRMARDGEVQTGTRFAVINGARLCKHRRERTHVIWITGWIAAVTHRKCAVPIRHLFAAVHAVRSIQLMAAVIRRH